MATTYMDTSTMNDVANGFDTTGDVLRAVALALEAAIMILKATAFVGLFGNVALARYLSNIKPKVEQLGDKCNEMGEDIKQAIANHQQASEAGDSI